MISRDRIDLTSTSKSSKSKTNSSSSFYIIVENGLAQMKEDWILPKGSNIIRGHP